MSLFSSSELVGHDDCVKKPTAVRLRVVLAMVWFSSLAFAGISQIANNPKPTVPASASRLTVESETIRGPADPAGHEAWSTELNAWRRQQRERIGHDRSQYERPEMLWTQRSFIQPQMMVEDRYFFDPQTGRYTVDRYLDDLDRRYGGIDSVLIWPVYPNIGIDNRNQHDLLRDMPGGLTGVREDGRRLPSPRRPRAVSGHALGHGHPAGRPAVSGSAARLMKEIGADGINGDTMRGIAIEFRRPPTPWPSASVRARGRR